MIDSLVVVVCAKCGNLMKVSAALAGKRGRCTKCGEDLSIPEPDEGEAAPPVSPGDWNTVEKSLPDLPQVLPKPQPFYENSQFVVGCGAAAILLFLLGVVWIWRSSAPPSPLPIVETDPITRQIDTSEFQKRERELRTALKAQQQSAVELSAELQKTQAARDELSDSLDKSRRDIEQLQQEIADLRTDYESKLTEAQQAREDAEEKLSGKTPKNEWTVEVVGLKSFDPAALERDINTNAQFIAEHRGSLDQLRSRYESMRAQNSRETRSYYGSRQDSSGSSYSAQEQRAREYSSGGQSQASVSTRGSFQSTGSSSSGGQSNGREIIQRSTFTYEDLSAARTKIGQVDAEVRNREIKIKQLERQIQEGRSMQIVIAKDQQGELVSLIAKGNISAVAATMRPGQRYVVGGIRQKLRDGVQILVYRIAEAAPAQK